MEWLKHNLEFNKVMLWSGALLCILSLFACSSQFMEPESSSPESHAAHNEKVIDQYLTEFINSKDDRPTGFTEAARWGRIDIVEDLLRQEIDVNVRDRYGRTALILAASGGQLEIMTLLIQQGADVNARAADTNATPLLALLASLHSSLTYYEGADILMNAGADLTVADRSGRRASDWARERLCEDRVIPEFVYELEQLTENALQQSEVPSSW